LSPAALYHRFPTKRDLVLYPLSPDRNLEREQKVRRDDAVELMLGLAQKAAEV
jgi:hypothetical protein